MILKNTMNNNQTKIQEKWNNGFVLGYDCLTFGNGEVVIGNFYSTYDPNNGEIKQYWSPICDTTLDKIQKYNEDIWTPVEVFHGSFSSVIYGKQTFVFGDGSMGNEGYIASTTLKGELNWSMFFTFSNPIHKAEIIEGKLICYGDTGTKITIDLNELTKVKVEHLA